MKLRDIILWILVIFSIIIVIWYLFGNSPSFEQTILILILTILFSISTKIVDISHKIVYLERRFSNLEKSFINLINDFKRMRKKK